jgi:hypothetical protein
LEAAGVRRLARVALTIAGAIVTASVPGDGRASDSRELLPDLVQPAPTDVSVVSIYTSAGFRYRLGFTTRIVNRGAGALRVVGHRASRSRPEMSASQNVKLSGGGWRSYPRVGTLRYIGERDHRHWHLLGFDHYSLLRKGLSFRRAHKLGFCLGDRAREDQRAGAPLVSLGGRCGDGMPDLLSVREGISVGWADVYMAQIEGQYFEVTGLSPGRYRVVERVNADRRIHESDYDNDVAWADIAIGRFPLDGQPPKVTVLARCGAPRRC